MGTLQEDCEAIGRSVRKLHTLIDKSGSLEMRKAIAEHHGLLEQGFANHIRPEHPELDYTTIGNDRVDGNEMQAASGTKHEPGAEN